MSLVKSIRIGQHWVGENHPTYIIAEISGNHNGSYEKAVEIIHAAKDAGVHAIKLQTYTADTITLNSDKPDFCLPSNSPWESSKTLYSLYAKAFTPWEWHKGLFEEARKIGLDIFSSPFDDSAVALLESLDVPVYKIASPEITDIPLLQRVAKTGKPVILSTGLAAPEDISLALETLRNSGCSEIILLKCTSAYPSPPETMNLATISDIPKTYGVIPGLSDHSIGVGIPVAAVVLGAKVIEKHIVFDKSEETVDSFFSLDRHEFKVLVEEIRKVEKAIGSVTYDISDEAKKTLWARRSLYVSKPIKKGETLNASNIRSVRPAFGLHPKYSETVLGKTALKDLDSGDRLSWDAIGGV